MVPEATSPTGHRFGRRRLLAGEVHASPAADAPFEPVPPATGSAPYRLSLADVIGAEAVAAITAAGSLTFHLAGDTGGIANPVPQTDVAASLERDLNTPPAGWRAPAFLYILGDCIYFNGQESQYFPQFYEPYANYNVPIFAVPGNHDGAPIDATQTTLDGFIANFCTATPEKPAAAGDSQRSTMTQPNVYWTLEAPWLTVIGLYSNVPEYGRLDPTQIAWLHSELAAAPTDRALMVTMHHPAISADGYHSSSAYMGGVLDDAMKATGRIPDLICAGHVHDYQRHTRQASEVGGTGTITYLVSGNGGYHNLHTIATDVKGLALPSPFPAMPGVTIDTWDDSHYGYCRLRVGPSAIDIEYVRVSPPPGVGPAAISPTVADTVTIPVRRP